ncbi:MAG: Xaa-Pro dipeptidase [OM182 bacterium MED-G28]|uniref:Xaa-Pro dipeptidase n=1 Tax=OM182 bacterium MED-G28 TaxID=1986256 RepID=A0A2A5WAI7_9GAMM|nr:MAG: Xaa-Pro dipeptidase [OM182 bacterium MED-G28]
MFRLIIASTFLASFIGFAVPTSAQDEVKVIRAGQLLDVTNGRMLSDQLIVVRNNVIEAVGDANRINIPSGAIEIDLSNSTILPGLIDAHVHLTSDASVNGYDSLSRSSIRNALYGTYSAGLTLRSGFTTVRNVGAVAYGDVALRDSIVDGEVAGPRMIVAGQSLGITGGHCDNNLLPAEYDFNAGGVADGPWALRQKVRENNKYSADLIKFCATGGVMSKGTSLGAQQFTQEEMNAIVDEAHTLGMKVAAHAHGTNGIQAAIRAGVDSIEHASILDDETIRLALEYETALVMDIYVSDYILESGTEVGMLEESLAKEREVGQVQRESFQRAHAAGVNIVFGSDAGVYPHGLNGRQFSKMVEFGMSPMQAIQAATLKAAALLGLENQVGTLNEGAYADLIAVQGNPLENVSLLENIGFVMKDGEVFLNQFSN